ncbi:MAG: maltose alpha-D-glucosyltransferase [Myxococcota bacterium]|nr:maltose alpha-D-glucosyltransferase [Myxococcota bacterium]
MASDQRIQTPEQASLAKGGDPLWYKDAVIYQLHVKAFRDSTRDGYGDFSGLIEKLDYIQSLGVTAVWLLPFYPSPLRDDGYDIADYRAINPRYGTMKDFRRFVRAAHDRDIRVITELVINHTSDQHAWFQAARRAPPGSQKRNYYVWSDSDERYKGARIIFTDSEKSNWTWDPVAKQYFWHRFFHHQPDLNFDNPNVRRAILKIMKYWLDMGVDGLRLDAVPYLIERDGTNCENLPETHEVLKEMRREMDRHYSGRLFLAEANQWPSDVRPYFGDDDECQMAFHFPLMPRMYMALRREDATPIIEILRQTPDIPPNCQWAIFLRNHDELTLEMVSDEERDYMYREYATDPLMRINVGIRRRLAPLLGNGRRQIELMNALLFTMPGTPIIYYGDEIGMGDNVYLGDRNGVRTPMQWTGDRNAGFSEADTAALYSPIISDPPYGYQSVNVEAQDRTSTSLLAWMRRVIKLRKQYKAFGRGTFEILPLANRKILAYLRQYENEVILVVACLSRFAQAAELDLKRFAGSQLIELFGETPFPIITEMPYLLTFAPHGFYMFRIERPDVG